jgi:hypothetical protein
MVAPIKTLWRVQRKKGDLVVSSQEILHIVEYNDNTKISINRSSLFFSSVADPIELGK